MNVFFVLGIALCLSADAFTVAVTNSTVSKEMPVKYGVRMAAFFGAFQFMMPIFGWAAGIKFSQYITAVDHWIAFALLTYVGGKMIMDSLSLFKKDGDSYSKEKTDYKSVSVLLLLSIATSIDALAIGLTFAVIKTDIFLPALIIGAVAFIISLMGFFIGKKIGENIKIKPDIIGGIVLIGIGIKILIEHLGH